jgi:Zn-dependent M32 family carboxypeptidase
VQALIAISPKHSKAMNRKEISDFQHFKSLLVKLYQCLKSSIQIWLLREFLPEMMKVILNLKSMTLYVNLINRLMQEINSNLKQNLPIGSNGQSNEQTPFRSPVKGLSSCNSQNKLVINDTKSDADKGYSKSIRISKVLEMEKVMTILNYCGKIIFCEPHYLNKE